MADIEVEELSNSDLDGDAPALVQLFAAAAEKQPYNETEDGVSVAVDYYTRAVRKVEGKAPKKCADMGPPWKWSRWQANENENAEALAARRESMMRGLVSTITTAVDETPDTGAVRLEFVRCGSKNVAFHVGPWWAGRAEPDEVGSESLLTRKSTDNGAIGIVAQANAISTQVAIRKAADMAARSDDRSYNAGVEVGTSRAAFELLSWYKLRNEQLLADETSATWASAVQGIGEKWASAAEKAVVREDLPAVLREVGAIVTPIAMALASAVAARQAAPATGTGAGTSSTPGATGSPAQPQQPPATPEQVAAASAARRVRILAMLAGEMKNGTIKPEDLAGVGGAK